MLPEVLIWFAFPTNGHLEQQKIYQI